MGDPETIAADFQVTGVTDVGAKGVLGVVPKPVYINYRSLVRELHWRRQRRRRSQQRKSGRRNLGAINKWLH